LPLRSPGQKQRLFDTQKLLSVLKIRKNALALKDLGLTRQQGPAL
jgi:hypothetical protein